MIPLQLFDPASSTYTYIPHDSATRGAHHRSGGCPARPRPGGAAGARPDFALWLRETHNHADHITSAGLLAEHTGHARQPLQDAESARPACSLAQGMRCGLWGRKPAVPGHARAYGGSLSYLWRGHVFTGDALLINGCGRTRLQSAMHGSSTAALPRCCSPCRLRPPWARA